MPNDPLDDLRLPSAPIEPRPGFTAGLRRRVLVELGSLLPLHYQQELASMTAQTEVASAPTVTAALDADDAPALIRWLVDVLEFRVTALHEEQGGEVAHAVLSWRSGNVFVSTRHPGPWGATGPSSICLAAEHPSEVDRLHQRARAANVEIVQELHDTGWGSHEFGVRDPEGNLWWIGTYRPPAATA